MSKFKNNRNKNMKHDEENNAKSAVKNSAKDIEIPESISPEKMREKLNTLYSEKSEETSNQTMDISKSRKKIRNSKKIGKLLAAAAAFALVFATALSLHEQDGKSTRITSSKETTSSLAESGREKDSLSNTENYDDSSKISDSSKLSAFYYTTTYEDIKEKIKNMWTESMIASDRIAYSGTEKQAVEESASLTTETTIDTTESGSSKTTSSYSTTNLQVEGVDEGDSIKTDGNYFYILTKEGQIRIVDTKTLKEVSTISDEIDGDEVDYSEIYVADKRLILAGNIYTSSLKKQKEDTYYMDSSSQAVLITYDISDIKNPKQIGKVYQDGTYRTSRKIGDYIYLFSDYSYYPDTIYSSDGSSMEESSSAKLNIANDSDIIPTVNQKEIAEDSIYIPREVSTCNYLVISSIHLKEPSKTLDEKSIMQSGNDFHITKESIYVLQTDWNFEHIKTNIIRFSFQNGKISPVDAASLDGELTDSFAINESNSYLRVLLTDWGADSTQTNAVYVLDNKMNVVGEIKNLAPGETIYSARFMGDIGYFVTYRNTDPLFSVDFSEPENPKIIGELKITGFSEYLHFYGEDKLFGLGRETDPDTGEFLGIKLSMFDIRNPKDVKEEEKLVLKGIDDCEALDNYKAILIDDEKNLIGFAVQDYKNGVYHWEYLVFAYDEKEGFVKKLDYGFVQDSYNFDTIRGIYIDSVLYIVRDSEIVAFDMEEGFKQVRKVSLG